MKDNVRKCIGCLKTFNRNEMFRLLVKHDTKELIISPTNKDFGRSVYICKNKNCVEQAFKKGRIDRYVKKNNPEEIKEKLKNFLTK